MPIQVRTGWVREGLEGRSLKATLYLYLFGLAAITPVAGTIAIYADASTTFLVTPGLVALLVGAEYLFSRVSPTSDRPRRVGPTLGQVAIGTEAMSYMRHAPLYDFVAVPILLLNLIWSLFRAATGFSVDTAIGVVVAVAILLVAFFARVFALGAQDRVIRLEERLRMQHLLADDLKPRINDFTTNQMIALLRFASDAELPDLARKVLDDNIGESKAVKQLIKTWRADYQRQRTG